MCVLKQVCSLLLNTFLPIIQQQTKINRWNFFTFSQYFCLFRFISRAAYSYWSKAVDSALQNSGVVEKWDGVSFGGGPLQQVLKQAGIWGCLQAAGLTAKIAQ